MSYFFIFTVGYLLHFPAISIGVLVHEIGHGLIAFFLTKDDVKVNIGLGASRKKLCIGRFFIDFSNFPWSQGKTECNVYGVTIIRRLLILIAGSFFNLIQIFLSIYFITISNLPIRCIVLAWLLANIRVVIGSLNKNHRSEINDLERIKNILVKCF